MVTARLRIVRRCPAPGRPGRVGIRVTAVAVGAAVAVVATPALAATSGSVQATVNTAPPPVKSVTLSTSALTFGSCSGGNSTPTQLGFPSANCFTDPVTVTNGSAPSVITIALGQFSPSDGGTPWTFTQGNPGQDQFAENLQQGNTSFPLIQAGDDPVFSPLGKLAPAGASAAEQLHLFGPSGSTDPSPQFTQAVTWTAT